MYSSQSAERSKRRRTIMARYACVFVYRVRTRVREQIAMHVRVNMHVHYDAILLNVCI